MKKSQKVEQMQKALETTIKSKITPVATFMIGLPGETLESLYSTTRFWVKNDIICKPFFVTPYPHTPLFGENRKVILEQYDAYEWLGGPETMKDIDEDLKRFKDEEDGAYERFVLALGDATKFTVNLTGFSDPELIGLRELMATHDLKRLRLFAKTKGVDLPVPVSEEAENIPEFEEGSMGEIIKV